MEEKPAPPVLPTKLRDHFGYNAAIADDELSFAKARCIYALDRRDRLQERVRFGSLALNAASLLALLSAVGGEDSKLDALGISAGAVTTMTVLYILGVTLAALAVWVSNNFFVDITGLEIVNLYNARRKKALFDDLSSESGSQWIKEELDKDPKPLGDFEFSRAEIALINSSGSAWLAGTAVALLGITGIV